MSQAQISAAKQNGKITVCVSGRFGGGYTAPGQSIESAAAMVLRDTPRYDCADEPISIALHDEVAAEIQKMLANGEALRACLCCPHRQ